MTRYATMTLLVLVAMGMSACGGMEGKKASLGTMQVSAVHWDEMAAASTAAHVNNNGLIMMR